MNRKNVILGILGGFTALITSIVLIYILIPIRRKRMTATPQPGLPGEGNDQQITIDESEECEPDDLTRVDGIGEKVTAALMDAGITRFAQLASMEYKDIQAIMDRAGVRVVAQDAWVTQAKEFLGDS